MTHRQIVSAIEETAPLRLQEEWDNSGFQIGHPDQECTGVLVCVDATEDIISEAEARGCNLVVAHHPLIFKGVRQILGRGRVERVVEKAILAGVTIYSSHTSVDNAPGGVSAQMASALGLSGCEVLSPMDGNPGAGCGMVGNLSEELSPEYLVGLVKRTFATPVARCSDPAKASRSITRVALCGGAGSDFIPAAIAAGAQAYINSDTKLNFFLDHADDIFIIDIGHHESEKCTKQIFYRAISKKFPNFAIYYSDVEQNPIHYL